MRFALDRRFLLSIQRGVEGTPAVVYDLKLEKIEADLTAYGGHLIRKRHLDVKTVEGDLYQICRFREHMHNMKWDLDQLADDKLEKYRDDWFSDAKKSARRQSERVAKTTVNAGLRAIYAWLRWLKSTGRANKNLIGDYPCRVISEQRQVGARMVWTTPLLLRRSGTKSRHKEPGFVPTEDTRFQVLAAIHEKASTPFLAHRNALFQRIVETVGLRRASTLSLTTKQFDRKLLSKQEGEGASKVDVTPSAQKFGYEDSYIVPMALAYEICGFVEGPRNDLLKAKGWSERRTEGAVFISEKTGKPLMPRSMTAIFSRIMRDLGAPPGTAIHAWRHRYFQEDVEKETVYRVAVGLDTSDASIAASVSLRGGHKNPESILPYVASGHSVRRAMGHSKDKASSVGTPGGNRSGGFDL